MSKDTLEGLRALLGVEDGKGGDRAVWQVRATPLRTRVPWLQELYYTCLGTEWQRLRRERQPQNMTVLYDQGCQQCPGGTTVGLIQAVVPADMGRYTLCA